MDVKGDTAWVTINRPEAMNALNEGVVAQLDTNFTRAEQDPNVKAIVIQGAGKAFVAGADIRYFVKNIKADRIQNIADFTRAGHATLLKIENSAKLTICLLDGLSLGGGSELALACQAIVATPAASMAFPETGIGIFPGLGGMLRFAKHTSPALAKYYTFTGAPIKAADAEALGIITRLVQPAEVEAAIAELVSQGKPDKYRAREIPAPFSTYAALCETGSVDNLLAGQAPDSADEALAAKTTKIVGFKAPLALKIANEIIDAQAAQSIAEGVETELGRLEEIFGSDDALEGLSSAGRKRPEFKGS